MECWDVCQTMSVHTNKLVSTAPVRTLVMLPTLAHPTILAKSTTTTLSASKFANVNTPPTAGLIITVTDALVYQTLKEFHHATVVQEYSVTLSLEPV
ncbi:hypothetical protein J6590_031378 [Homalodisca vitripennis]|nr:hypothetical protein J6590_031378 [Homalodisca vitripennis]